MQQSRAALLLMLLGLGPVGCSSVVASDLPETEANRGVVALEAVRVGSFDIDAHIQTYIRREYGIAIGERTAEEIKVTIGSAWPTPHEYSDRKSVV